MKNKITISLKSKFYLSVLIAVVSLLIATGGYLFYKQQADVLLHVKYDELKAIADLKESQIGNWQRERNADAKVLSQSPFFIDGINRWLQDTMNVQLKEDIIERLIPVQKELGYENIFLAKTNGVILLSVTDSLVEIDAFLKQKIAETAVKREIVFTDFYQCKKENKIYFDIIAPVINNKNKTIAVLVFRRDPNDFLYPLIKTWPIPDKSGETVILRVENDSVVFLNEMRFRKNTALKLKIPLTRTEFPSVQAALGRTGLCEGIDYRGIKVLSDIRIIPGTNWIMLSKIDKSEIYAGLYLLAGITASFTIILIIACGIGFAFIYNTRQKTIYKELYSKEKELWQQQEKFKVTMDSLGEGIITLDIDGKVQYMNKLAQEMTEWNQREARGRELHDIYPVKNEETGQRENNILAKIYKHGLVKELANHTLLISKSGKEIPVMDTGAPVYDNDGTVIGIVIAFQDETEKRYQKRQLEESERRYRKLIDTIPDTSILVFDKDLRFLVAGGEEISKSGFDRNSVEGRTLSVAYPPEVVELFEPLYNKALKGELTNFEHQYGDLYYHQQIIPLNDAHGNIFAGMVISRNITARKLAEEALRASDELLQSAIKILPVGLWIFDAEGKIIFSSDAAQRIWAGVRYVDVNRLGEYKGWRTDSGKLIEAHEWAGARAVEKGETSIEEEVEIECFDGTRKIILDTAVPLRKSDGSIGGAITMNQDITERKLAEKQIAESEARYRNLVENAAVGVYETTTDGKVLFGNKALIDMFGFKSLEEFMSSPVVINYKNPKRREELISALKQHGKVDNFEIEIDSRDGRELYILISAKLNGNILTGMVVDVTERIIASSKLEEAHRKLQLASAAGKVALWNWDFANNTLEWSSHVGRMLGYEEEEFPQTLNAWEKIIHPDDYKDVDSLLNKHLEKKTPYEIEYRVFKKDGSLAWWHDSGIAEFNSDGKPVAMSGVCTDITARKLAEEELLRSEELLRMTGDIAKVGGWELDLQTNLLRFTLETYRIHEVDPAIQPSLETAIDFYAPEARPVISALVQKAITEGVPWDIELPFITATGRNIWVRAMGVPLFQDGKCVRLFGAFQDITERKLAEEKLHNLNASLEIKIEERTGQLFQAKTAAEIANVAKSEFLSRMSHELRTPLNSILGFTQLLYRSETNPESQKRINQIMSSGKHLLDLINEVLDLAGIESGKLSLSMEPVELSGIITETLDIVHLIAEKREIKLELVVSPVNNLFVNSDRQKLKQVMINLINNAVKYNRHGGEVEVVITQTGENIRISVRDTGIGIAAEELHKLFEPFQRIGTEISEVEGTGLGLAVAKKLVVAMNGSIGVESEVGVGSTFWIELPQTVSQLERSEQTRNRNRTANPDSTRSGILLYIEDNISNIQLVEDIIETERPNVSLLAEMYGKNAVKMATDYKPRLILLDLDLPDIHGSKVLNLLLAEPATKDIPVVVLSADAMPHTIERLLAAGAKHYLTKPLDVDKFLEVADEIMNYGEIKND